MIFSCRFSSGPLLLAGALLLGTPGCKPGSRSGGASSGQDLKAARAGFTTQLLKQEAEGGAPEKPPEGVFELVHYSSPAGSLAAYVSPTPEEGGKHPLVIWLTGGFSNSISSLAWEEGLPADNDQSAAAYRLAGIPMMYPSLRGGNDNPGHKEGLYGEVDDVLAAAAYAAQLPWVDPQRIYLAGHSTGGTLALLTAEAADPGRFRAVVSFGPVESVALYGPDAVPFNVNEAKEARLRSPAAFLNSIKCPTLVIEGDGEPGNLASLESLRRRNRNPEISFTVATGMNHFSVLAPANALLAEKILQDRGPSADLALSDEELHTAGQEARAADFIAPGSVQDEYAQTGVVLYHNKPEETRAVLEEMAAKWLPGVKIYASFDEAEAPPFLVLEQEKAPFSDYPVPDADYFDHAGRSLSDEDITRVQKSTTASGIMLVTQATKSWEQVRQFNGMVSDCAEKVAGYVWDSPTRECFTREAWKKIRIDSWGTDAVADVRGQITIHAYQAEDDSPGMRVITLGMGKFGLPDVVMSGVNPSARNPAMNFVNAVCQELASRPVIEDPENFTLDLAKLKPESVVEDYQGMIIGSGTGKIVLSLMKTTPEEGDEENSQVALDFRHSEGATDDERRSSAISSFWGSTDAVVGVVHDDEVKAASAAAREKLMKLAPEFRAGFPSGTEFMVKGPFPRDDGKGNEWMWVEVQSWKEGGPIEGLLQNDPYYIKDLKAGAKVSIDPEKAFDYSLQRPGEEEEGNETGKILQKRQQK